MKILLEADSIPLEYIGCVGLAGLIPRLPRRVCLALARTVWSGACFTASTAVRAPSPWTTCVSPWARRSTPASARRSPARRFATSPAPCSTSSGRATSPARASPNTSGWRTSARSYETHARHGGIIFLSLHAGSHEWVSLTSGFIGAPSSMVALDFKNPALDAVFRRAREGSGNRIIGQKRSMLRLLRAVKRGGVGLLADLALKLDQPGELIDLRDEDARHLPARAAARAHGGAHRAGHQRPPPRRHLHRDRARAAGVPARHRVAHDHAGVLGFFRAVHPRPARTLAVELQALPLPAARRTPEKYPFYAHWSDRFEEILQGTKPPTDDGSEVGSRAETPA